MELLLGCGNSRNKLMYVKNKVDWEELITLDIKPSAKPDILHDLNDFPYPFPDNYFDEIHAYEVMEHLGCLGDWQFFFDQWTELSRITKPDGLFFGTSPHHTSPWAWGDPSHTRIITQESFSFLSQPMYKAHVGHSHMTDFRDYYKADWELIHAAVDEQLTLSYVLQCKKGNIDA